MTKEDFLGRLYKDGEVVVGEGMRSRTMYVMQSGKVKVVRSYGGKEIELAILGEGDVFGEMSLFDASPRSATVIVVGEARILAIEHEGLLKRIKMDPTLAFRIIKQMSQRVRALNSRLTSAQKLIDEANHELLYLGDTKAVSTKDQESKLSSILSNVSQIRNELHNLKEIVTQVDKPLSRY
ncbi:MAG: cyclic nucleotide-binding domain-containing protein [Candidatus Scalindua sp.]